MSERTNDSPSSDPAPNKAATRRAPPRKAPTTPNQRRGGRCEMAHHPPRNAESEPD